jgi:hypothetical protein
MTPRISLWKPEATRSHRISSFGNYTVKKYFENLDLLMEKYKIVEIIAFNVDETVQKHPKMLWPEDQKESGPAIC